MKARLPLLLIVGVAMALAGPASAQQPFHFSTGNPNGLIATGARIPSLGQIQIETGDDFVLTAQTTFINHATFTGLLIGGAVAADISDVNVDLYHVFPRDSVNPPSGNVPTRTNSPSDTEFDGRNFLAGTLSFTTHILNANFTAANSVLNGIHPLPNQHTGGEGPVTGTEVQFDVDFATPFDLPADHYFFVPTVALTSNGEFMWLSAPRPIVSPGTPFAPDLQSWIRNEELDPDWLRIGTDIVGGNAYNATFSLDGSAVPEPSSLALWGLGSLGAFLLTARSRRRR